MHKSQNENNFLTLSISKADRSMFLKLANELILQNEFNDFVAEEKRYKFQNKYTSWYNGFTEMRLSYLSKAHITIDDYHKRLLPKTMRILPS